MDALAARFAVQMVWPITDEGHTRSELIEAALPQLLRFAAAHRTYPVGPPMWRVAEGTETLGWEAWLGLVLIGVIPVDPAPRSVEVYLDEVKVARAVEGQPVKLTRTERRAAVAQLAGLSAVEVARRLRMSPRAVEQARQRARNREVSWATTG